MSRKCDICGKGPQFGHKISHAHNVSPKKWLPNLHSVKVVINKATKKLRICTRCLRSGKVQKA